jgi:predicted GH43/DUF377 family glycosyl hydrolase
MRVSHRRLISRGDFPGSDGGIYNPGVIETDAGIVLLCRREIDYRFSSFVHAERVLLDVETLDIVDHSTLRPRGYPDGARREDFRCTSFDGQTLCIHTLVHEGRIRPVLSRFDDRDIRFFDPLELPLPIAPVEKNWVLFEHEGALHCLYQLDPLTIFARRPDGAWALVKREENGWGDDFTGTLSNSANLIPFMDGYLGFWHSIVAGRYVQGAVLLDHDLAIRYRTDALLDGERVRGGHKHGALYVTALVERNGRIFAFYGEGDAHTSVAEFDSAELEAELRSQPFQAGPTLKVRLAVRRMGDLYRAMIALQRLSRDLGEPRIRLYVDNLRLAPAIAVFGVPRLRLRGGTDAVAFDYDLSGA